MAGLHVLAERELREAKHVRTALLAAEAVIAAARDAKFLVHLGEEGFELVCSRPSSWKSSPFSSFTTVIVISRST